MELKENKFKPADLPKVADKYPKLQILFLSDNNITDYKELQPLTKLKEIVQLELNNTPLSKKPDYRYKVFEMFSALEVKFPSILVHYQFSFKLTQKLIIFHVDP